jgi:hypothetical protein
MVLQNKKYKRPLIGLLIGPMIMKQVLKEGSIMRRNSPTIPALIVQETSGDLSILKGEWKALLNSYAEYTLPDFSFVHPFFGKMTREQVGFFAYKHADHHLKQFNC